MHLFPNARAALTLLLGCVLAAGMLSGAQAFNGADDELLDDEPWLRPRPAASAPAEPKPALQSASKAESKPEDKPVSKPVSRPAQDRKPAEKAAVREPDLAITADPAAQAKAAVSMAELRELIDQKIAEVRSQRQAQPPVVRLRSKSPAAAKTQAKGSAGKNTASKPAALTNGPQGRAGHDGSGALLPLPEDQIHAHSPEEAAQVAAGRWSYSGATGPEQWGRLKPEFQLCARGKRQSPIDIRDGIPVQLDPIQFDYRPSGFRVVDNGHTVQVEVEPGNSITVQGRRYELQQFHFHRPSEERINGRQFEMVAHLVHKDAEGRMAIVAVLMEAGKGHPLVQQVWNNLPLERMSDQVGLNQMDLSLLVPTQRQYFTYMGSMTTPPCTEGVLWMVMKHPAAVSREQIGVFSRLYPMNARPIQSTSGRLIKDGQ